MEVDVQMLIMMKVEITTIVDLSDHFQLNRIRKFDAAHCLRVEKVPVRDASCGMHSYQVIGGRKDKMRDK